MIITTEPTDYPDADLQEIASRHDSIASAMGALVRALDTIPLLIAEVRRLRARLARTLADLHNLIAAARATLGAHADGEDDALYYLRDELDALGQLPPEHGSGREQPPLAPPTPPPGPPGPPRRLPADDGLQPERPAT